MGRDGPAEFKVVTFSFAVAVDVVGSGYVLTAFLGQILLLLIWPGWRQAPHKRPTTSGGSVVGGSVVGGFGFGKWSRIRSRSESPVAASHVDSDVHPVSFVMSSIVDEAVNFFQWTQATIRCTTSSDIKKLEPKSSKKHSPNCS